jgi:hypothetical protein
MMLNDGLKAGFGLYIRRWSAVGLFRILTICSIALFVASPVSAAVYYVSLAGADENTGTLQAPFRTINYAVAKLQPGDTLFVRDGTYFENVRVRVSGTKEASITIRSYPGERATIDSGIADFRRVGNSDWEIVDPNLGEYRSVRQFPASGYPYAYVEGIPGYENQRVFLVPYKSGQHFRAPSADYVNPTTPVYVGPGVYYDPSDERIHIRLAKTADLKSAEARYGHVFDGDLPDPRHHSIILSMARYTVDVSGSYLTFKDLTINQASRSIRISASVQGLQFLGMTVWNGAKGIAAEADNVHDVLITQSRIYGDNPYWVFWSDIKDEPFPAELLRTTSLDLRGGARDWTISYNHIRGSGQDLVSTNTNEDRIFIHHNRLENCLDDAIEIEGTVNVGSISVYENYISNCLTALAPGQSTPKFSGPLLFYRNVVSLLREPPVNRAPGINAWNSGSRFGFFEMFKNNTGPKDSTRNTHIYQNTLLLLGSTGRGINFTPKYPEGTRIANNIVMTVNGRANGEYRLAKDQVVDGNLYWKINTADTEHLVWTADTVQELSKATGIEARGIGETPKRGTNPHLSGLALNYLDRSGTVWRLSPESEVRKVTDFMLCAGSPAIGGGIKISPPPVIGNLPDTRSSRDIGAIPFGTSAEEYEVFPFTSDLHTRPSNGPSSICSLRRAENVFASEAMEREIIDGAKLPIFRCDSPESLHAILNGPKANRTKLRDNNCEPLTKLSSTASVMQKATVAGKTYVCIRLPSENKCLWGNPYK